MARTTLALLTTSVLLVGAACAGGTPAGRDDSPDAASSADATVPDTGASVDSAMADTDHGSDARDTAAATDTAPLPETGPRLCTLDDLFSYYDDCVLAY